MTYGEIQKLMEFIVTQQAEITVQQAEITAQQNKMSVKQDDFAIKQAQIMDIHFETAKHLAEFEKITGNRIQFIIEHQADLNIKMEELAKESKAAKEEIKELAKDLRSVSKRVDKLETEDDSK